MAGNSSALIINCLIADDEPLARQGMQLLAEHVPFFKLVGIAKDAHEVKRYLSLNKVDLLFLDIQMPIITGIDLVKSLSDRPKVIFATAFPDYAVESYELDILDYLVKPITLQRFLKSADKAREYFESLDYKVGLSEKKPLRNFLFIKTNKKIEKVLFDEIMYVEAMLNYVIIYLTTQKLITYSSMKTMEDLLPRDRFMRIHKSYIVALNKINSLERKAVNMSGKRLPVSRSHRDKLVAAIIGQDKISSW